ncbi:MAG TPA: response regulator [Puia sp.]|jgi:CheY-like chemotaxis protein|nr:response regulator [Puia sp.]
MKTIFLIDDDPVFVYLTKKIICSVNGGCEIMEFSDGELAIDHLRTISGDSASLPDVIFVDLSMPVMDGWEFLDEYTQLQSTLSKRIELFIVSSSISPQEVERSKTYPAVLDFLIKPVAKGKIAEIMSHV